MRIEFEAPKGSYVSFPIWAWHQVFCRSYLPFSEQDARNWSARLKAAGVSDADLPLPAPFDAELRASWLRVFGNELPDRSWRKSDPFRGREAVLPDLKLGWVKGVTKFVGTNRSMVAVSRLPKPHP